MKKTKEFPVLMSADVTLAVMNDNEVVSSQELGLSICDLFKALTREIQTMDKVAFAKFAFAYTLSEHTFSAALDRRVDEILKSFHSDDDDDDDNEA